MTDIHEMKQKTIARLSRCAAAKHAIDSVHRYRMRHARKLLHSDGYRICSDVCRELEAEGIKCYALSGTLLGLVRDGRFIQYDDDIDLAVVVDGSFDWGRAKSAMESAGCRLWREFGFGGKVTEQAYRFGRLGIDLFAQYPVGSGYRMYFYTYVDEEEGSFLRVKYLDQPDPEDIWPQLFNGYEISIPSNAEGLLIANYGEGWRVPDPNYVAGSRWLFLEDADCFVRYR